MKPAMKRWLLIVLAMLLLLAGIVWMMRPISIKVQTHVIERGALRVTVDEQGRTRVRQRYTIAAPIAGQFRRSSLDAGDRVQRDEIIASIAPPPEDSRVVGSLRAALEAAHARERESQARVAEVNTSYQRAAREAVRRAELFSQGLVSSEVRDQYQQTLAVAKSQVESAQASLAAAQAEVGSARARLLGLDDGPDGAGVAQVRAPVSGRVLRVHQESERVVAAGTPLFDLSDGDDVELVIDLLSQDAVRVKPGAAIVVSAWGGGRELAGRVRYVEPSAFTKVSALGVEEQRVNVVGDLRETPAGLGDGYRIDAAIVVWQHDDVLTVPISAIFRRRGAWHVFVVLDGVARLREIILGEQGAEYAEVVSGLEAGDKTIEYPSDVVADAVRVVD